MKNFCLFLIVLGFFSCNKFSREINSEGKVFDVSFNKEVNSVIVELSSIADSISYVQLELTEDNLIGEISDVEFVNNTFYILDQLQQVVFIFDRDGKYINKIAKRGQGPEEYVMLSAFDINPFDGSIHILDSYRKRMIVYSKQGAMLKTFSVKDFVRDITVFPNGSYLFYTPDYNLGNYRRGLWRVDSKGKFLEQLISIDDSFRFGSLLPKYFCRIKEDLVGLPGGEDFDNIYRVTEKSIEIPFRLDVDIQIPADLLKNNDFDWEDFAGRIYDKVNYAETDSYFMITVNNLKTLRIVFYDKNNSKGCYLKDLSNDIDHFTGGRFVGASYNKWIFTAPYFSKDRKEDDSIVVNETNPVLQIFHMKR